MALRKILEGHVQYFWGLLAKWLSGGFWRFILNISEACWPNGSQEAFWRLILSISAACWPNDSQEVSGGSFSSFLWSAGQMGLRKLLEVHFEQFWGLLAERLSGDLGRFFLSISVVRWPNGPQESSRGSF